MRWWPPSRGKPVDESRWVVLDVESSGLDPATDRLLAIAAVGLRVDWPARKLAIEPGDSFEAVLRQERPEGGSHVLIHGIGTARQASGVPADQALRAFAGYVAASPLLAFHAAFDRSMLSRHWIAGDKAPRNPWLDVEPLCAVTHPGRPRQPLDGWLEAFGIRCLARHRAAADALATAELLLRIWPRIARECRGWRDVARLAASRAWIPGA